MDWCLGMSLTGKQAGLYPHGLQIIDSILRCVARVGGHNKIDGMAALWDSTPLRASVNRSKCRAVCYQT